MQNKNIKRLIFDLDDTLIEWKEEYWNAANKALEELKIIYDEGDINKIKTAIDLFEDGRNITYDKKKMIEIINYTLGYKLPENFINIWLKYLGDCVPNKIEDDIIETLQYLKEKYDMVILTNWFKESQINRLKNVKLYDFFTEIYATEGIPMKPHKQSYLAAKGKFEVEECIMIGDSMHFDIEGALNAGMKAIYLKKSAELELPKIENANFIATINKISELKQIL